ncbi:hypothetical protein KKA14_02945 [bacterium]|nr:hypothetical protein [bacterium]
MEFRIQNPFEFWGGLSDLKQKMEQRFYSSDMSRMDDLFYKVLRQSGILFGCHVMKKSEKKHTELRYLNIQDQATFVNIEALFITLTREIYVLVSHLGSYEKYLARSLIRAIQFYLGEEIATRYFKMDVSELIKDQDFLKLIRIFEKKFLKRTRIEKKLSLTNSLQNNFAFLDIYSLINWNRMFHKRSSAPIYYLAEIEKNHSALQKQLVLIFAGLVWQSQTIDFSDPGAVLREIVAGQNQKVFLQHRKRRMIKRYIKTSRLPANVKKELREAIRKPVDLHKIEYKISDPIINKYMLEQTVLLALIDEEVDPSHTSFIHELGRYLGMEEEELTASIGSVADFFHEHENRFDFIRGNRSLHHLRTRINSQLTLIIGKNLDRIVKEIKLTGQLYSLLHKSGEKKLDESEKRFVRSQLLSIAKTIPALAIFCLPAGGMVLAVFVKLLPFNILPNSFSE